MILQSGRAVIPNNRKIEVIEPVQHAEQEENLYHSYECKVQMIHSSPSYPKLNGEAQGKQICKNGARNEINAVHTKLLEYRATQSAATKIYLAEAVDGRKFRTRLTRHQIKSRFYIGQSIWTRSYKNGFKWKKAVIRQISGQITRKKLLSQCKKSSINLLFLESDCPHSHQMIVMKKVKMLKLKFQGRADEVE
uniref:Uncharacterized protein n=1 Tax=Panagrolaimus superbus TaxID=310955 RepID=A0A914ZB24_9BILA